ncbi:MAG TPA: alpha-D-ribose 1-methylphosphonate 5-triphosphate diphosphatase [Ktedonobacterales bacterium]
MQHLIMNAVVVTPRRVFEGGWLVIEGDRIAAVGDASSCPTGVSDALDARGLLLLPGLIDLHCDAIEKLVEPRPNVHFELPLALAEADWRLAGCGITTEFHAVSLDDIELGVRSATFVHELIEHIRANRTQLVRHRIHARFEVSSEQGFARLLEWAELPEVGMISLMDHTPGQGQYQTADMYRDYLARVTGRSLDEIDELLERKRVQMRTAPQRVARVADLARRTGKALASHDDDTAERVASWPGLGVTVSEFPTTLTAAMHAHNLGLAVCMGAPNVLRGRSSGGNLSALAALEAGVVDCLCSDYYPSSMLAAVFKIVALGLLPLPQALNLVSLNPARAAGLGDFGALEAGRIADVALVAADVERAPRMERLYVGGNLRLTRAEVAPGGC